MGNYSHTNALLLAGNNNILISKSQPSKEVVVPLQEPLEQYLAKDLRKEVYRLKLKVTRKGPDANDQKRGYIALLRAYRNGNAKLSPARQAAVPYGVTTISKAVTPEHTQLNAPAPLTSPNDRGDDDSTIRLINVLFSDEFWRKLYDLHHIVAQKNKSMLSDTVTSNSIDIYGPKQGGEGERFWQEIAAAMNRLHMQSMYGSSLDKPLPYMVPEMLFEMWKRLCMLFNKARDSKPIQDPKERQELAYLQTMLHQRPGLAAVVTLGHFFSTFDPIVSLQRPQVVEISNGDADLAFITDDDGDNDTSNDETQGEDMSQDLQNETELPPCSGDEETVKLQREFWRHKNILVLQSIANAKLQFEIEHTKFLEKRLSGSKRKIQLLQDELQRVDCGSSDAELISQEMKFYIQERKKMLHSLLKQGEFA